MSHMCIPFGRALNWSRTYIVAGGRPLKTYQRNESERAFIASPVVEETVLESSKTQGFQPDIGSAFRICNGNVMSRVSLQNCESGRPQRIIMLFVFVGGNGGSTAGQQLSLSARSADRIQCLHHGACSCSPFCSHGQYLYFAQYRGCQQCAQHQLCAGVPTWENAPTYRARMGFFYSHRYLAFSSRGGFALLGQILACQEQRLCKWYYFIRQGCRYYFHLYYGSVCFCLHCLCCAFLPLPG